MKMSPELIAILVTSVFEVVWLSAILYRISAMLYRMHDKMGADDAALYLQGKKIEQILAEMRRQT
jgi:hypothetical protein